MQVSNYIIVGYNRIKSNFFRNAINQWVENTTHHMITNLLPPGTIDASTSLVLVNAAYFKGVWENKFNPNLTGPQIFYVSPKKQIMVDMMHMQGTFKHGKIILVLLRAANT